MSEVYINTSQKVYLDIYGATADQTPTAKLREGASETLLTVNGPVVYGDAQRWDVTVGFEHTQTEKEIAVFWEMEIGGMYASQNDWLEVVTPYATVADAKEELEIPSNITDKKIVKAERKARYLINRITGQTFGKRTGTITISGAGDSLIALPNRLISIDSFTHKLYGVSVGTGYEVRNDGWSLKRTMPVTESPLDGVTTSPIYNPFTSSKPVFGRDQEWVLSGTWGYERVPGPVFESALILMESELCNNSIYRDNYIQSTGQADSRMAYNAGAFEGFGNVQVDQLLADYRRPGIVLI